MADKGFIRNYKKIEEQIIKSGTTYQRKAIEYYRNNLTGPKATIKIEEFIDSEMDLGKIRVTRG